MKLLSCRLYCGKGIYDWTLT